MSELLKFRIKELESVNNSLRKTITSCENIINRQAAALDLAVKEVSRCRGKMGPVNEEIIKKEFMEVHDDRRTDINETG